MYACLILQRAMVSTPGNWLLMQPVPAAVMETVAVKLSGVGLPKPKTPLEILGAYIRKTVALVRPSTACVAMLLE